MQYKIPVQIERADKIIFGLSLKQLAILIVGFGIAYMTFMSLSQKFGIEIALMPTIFIVVLILFIVLFNQYEMTFLAFVLSTIRFNVNIKNRYFIKGVDAFQPIDIGFVTKNVGKVKKEIDFESKIDKIKKLDDQLKKI